VELLGQLYLNMQVQTVCSLFEVSDVINSRLEFVTTPRMVLLRSRRPRRVYADYYFNVDGFILGFMGVWTKEVLMLAYGSHILDMSCWFVWFGS